MLAGLESERERESEIERALLQSNPWVGDEEIYSGTQGLINAAGIGLTPTLSYTHTHTHTHRLCCGEGEKNMEKKWIDI